MVLHNFASEVRVDFAVNDFFLIRHDYFDDRILTTDTEVSGLAQNDVGLLLFLYECDNSFLGLARAGSDADGAHADNHLGFARLVAHILNLLGFFAQSLEILY